VTTIEVRLLADTDDRSKFESTHPKLTEFFRRFAGQNQFRHRIGSTYVALREGVVHGYATISSGSVAPADIKAPSLPKYPVPVLRLARMARHREAEQGVGKALLRKIFDIALQQALDVGCVGVLVDAKPEAVDYYAERGFTAIDPRTSDPCRMFLPIGTIEKARTP
jgi:GNAT superfamily N-acetyltransferase